MARILWAQPVQTELPQWRDVRNAELASFPDAGESGFIPAAARAATPERDDHRTRQDEPGNGVLQVMVLEMHLH
jgi:hypothetical protein